MARINEIETRLSAIKQELENPESDIAALSLEADALIEERTLEKSNIEKRTKLLNSIANGSKGIGVQVVAEHGDNCNFTASSEEYRCAYLRSIRNLDLSSIDKRAFSSVASSAGAVIPTSTANEIIKKIKQFAPMLNEITLLHVQGNVTFGVEATKTDAQLHTENATIQADDDNLVPVTLTSYEITKLVQVSKTIATMSINAFETWLTDMIAEKLAEKISALTISGTGTNQPQGIEKAATWGETNSITVAKTGSLTAANVQALIGLLSGSYDKNAKFLMSKKTLFSDFMPLQDNSKNSIVRDDNKAYTIYGYPVLIDESITLHEAYLGDSKKIVANLSENIEITSSFETRSNSFLFLGCAMYDCKVAVPEAFVKLIKATA